MHALIRFIIVRVVQLKTHVKFAMKISQLLDRMENVIDANMDGQRHQANCLKIVNALIL